jgi:hypothetical protein
MHIPRDTLTQISQILSHLDVDLASNIRGYADTNCLGLHIGNSYFLFRRDLITPHRFQSPSEPWQVSEIPRSSGNVLIPALCSIADAEGTFGVAVSTTDWAPVARLIDQYGHPPDLIITDWAEQLKNESQKSVVGFLTNTDGTLFDLQTESSLSPFDAVSPSDTGTTLASSWKEINWPSTVESRTKAHQHVPFAETNPITAMAIHEKAIVFNRPPNRHRQRGTAMPTLLRGFLVAGFVGALFWFSSSLFSLKKSETSMARNLDQTSTGNRLPGDTVSIVEQPNGVSETTNAMNFGEPTEIVVDDAKTPTDDLTRDLGDLLSLNPNNTTIDSQWIVNKSLESNPPLAREPNTKESVATANDSTVADSEEEKESSSDQPSRFPLQLNLALENSIQRKSVSGPTPIATRNAFCRVKLAFHEPPDLSLVVEPKNEQEIEGRGSARWRIGVEDEEPELVVEIGSTPGRKWELLTQVAFRENRTTQPRLLRSGDAKNVIRQLLDAKLRVAQWLDWNQAARDANVPRTAGDLYDQRRLLQSRSKQLDQSLETWKILEKLSYALFDHAQLQVNLSIVQPEQ